MKKLIIIFSLMLLLTTGSSSAVEIRLPLLSDYESQHQYKLGLLKLVLEKAGVEADIQFAASKTPQSRVIEQLMHGDEINLSWMGTSAELEQKLLPIRFPVYRGLLGHRVFVIHKDEQVKFDRVHKLSDLQQYQGGQGLGWSDTKILQHSGLKQRQASYDNLFKMINSGNRLDYFSRGVIEAFKEVDNRKYTLPNLVVEEKILLIYPFALFFFTNPSNTELAETLEDGFRKAYADGSFHDYFYNHPEIKIAIEQANMNQRVRIEIPNPSLSAETNAIPARYWHGR
ncbi:hypothetical protein A9Q78_08490 [Methylophaga sp. 41_12_T18]|nr:hypothetical protein A9Q78_08490 [Methylophaga sp. 41_12_T18]